MNKTTNFNVLRLTKKSNQILGQLFGLILTLISSGNLLAQIDSLATDDFREPSRWETAPYSSSLFSEISPNGNESFLNEFSFDDSETSESFASNFQGRATRKNPLFPESIVRGNISELSLDPYQGRITGYFFGERARIDASGTQAIESGFKTETFGGGLGQDRLLGDYVVWGFWLNGLSQKMKMTDQRYTGSLDSFSGKLHLSVFGKLWYLDLGVGVGKNWNENRTTISQSPDFVNKFTGTQWNYEGEFGLRILKGHTKIEPFLGFRMINLEEPGTAGIFPGSSIYIPFGYSLDSYRLTLGGRLAWEYSTYLADISPFMQAAWIHEFGDANLLTTNDLTPFPVAYRFGNHELNPNRAALGAGLTLALKDSFDLYFLYNSTLSKNYSNSNILGGFNKKF